MSEKPPDSNDPPKDANASAPPPDAPDADIEIGKFSIEQGDAERDEKGALIGNRWRRREPPKPPPNSTPLKTPGRPHAEGQGLPEPASGHQSPELSGGGVNPEATALALEVFKHRRRIGYGVMCAAGVFVVVTLLGSLATLDDVVIEIRRYDNDAVQIAVLSAHAAVTIACIYFAYQAMKLGERMSLPHWWVKNARDIIEFSQGKGVDAPLDALADAFKSALGKND